MNKADECKMFHYLLYRYLMLLQAAPGIVENYNTAFNDPAMYQIIARAVSLIQQFKQQLQPYKKDQVIVVLKSI